GTASTNALTAPPGARQRRPRVGAPVLRDARRDPRYERARSDAYRALSSPSFQVPSTSTIDRLSLEAELAASGASLVETIRLSMTSTVTCSASVTSIGAAAATVAMTLASCSLAVDATDGMDCSTNSVSA